MVDLELAKELASKNDEHDSILTIGVRKEHTLHKVIKFMIDPTGKHHEIKVLNKYADIYMDERIYEIQTKAFNNLRSKLDVLLDYKPVTIIYPTIVKKQIIKMNEEGEVIVNRKSPKKNWFSTLFFELYKIKVYLNHPNLQIQLFLMDIDEYQQVVPKSYRNRHGKLRIDQVPSDLKEIIVINEKEDYLKFLPELPQKFTANELQKHLAYPKNHLNYLIQVLKYLELIEMVGKDGRAYIYQIKNS